MYFPYFFSGHHEAETIFQLKNEINQRKLLPIVDINKYKPKFAESIKKVTHNEIQFILIVNPIYDLTSKQKKDADNLIVSLRKIKNNNIIIGINVDFNNLEIFNNFKDDSEVVLIHKKSTNNSLEIDNLLKKISHLNIKFNVFINNTTKLDYEKHFNNRVIMSDAFNKLTPNSKYKDFDDEFFYDLHITYKDNGYSGFGDYLTIGNNISDTQGRSPKTVVIHYTYPENELKEKIWIKRFFGDVNNTFSMQSDARLEAMQSLQVFLNDHIKHICEKCPACLELERSIKKESAYSLGKLKEFSMLHHSHMMCKLIDISI